MTDTNASLAISTRTQNLTTHTATGPRTGPHAFIVLTVESAGRTMRLHLDAGEWSRILANPGEATPVVLEIPSVETGAA